MRLQACMPNEAARKMFIRESGDLVITSKMVPSFQRHYLIAESSDLGYVTDSDFERFKEKLKWAGYTEIEMLTTLAGGKIEAENTPTTKTYKDLVDESRKQAGLPALEDAPF